MALDEKDRKLMKSIAYGDKLIEDDGEDVGPCASRATPKYWPSLEIRKRSGERFAFPYPSASLIYFDQTNTVIIIEVNTPDGPWQITIHGLRLPKIFSYLHQHRLEWVQEGHRDFGPEDKGFIENIDVTPVHSLERMLYRRLKKEATDRQLTLEA